MVVLYPLLPFVTAAVELPHIPEYILPVANVHHAVRAAQFHNSVAVFDEEFQPPANADDCVQHHIHQYVIVVILVPVLHVLQLNVCISQLFIIQNCIPADCIPAAAP